MNIAQIAPINPRATTRRTRDNVFPLRGASGMTFAEQAEQRKKEMVG